MRVLFNCKSPRVNLRLSSINPVSYLLLSFFPFCVPTEPVFLLVSSRFPPCYTAVSFLPSVLLILMVLLTIPSKLQALVLPLSSLPIFLQDCLFSARVFHMPLLFFTSCSAFLSADLQLICYISYIYINEGLHE